MKLKHTQHNAIRIGLASPREIQLWAERHLGTCGLGRPGQVVEAQTVHYKTLEPVKRGLFCERIFGPLDDFHCGCTASLDYNQRKHHTSFSRFCLLCGAEYTSSEARRYRLGYIGLANPVVHVWYLRGRLKYVSILLDLSDKDVNDITYLGKTKAFFDPLYFLYSQDTVSSQYFPTTVSFMPLSGRNVSLWSFELSHFLRYATNLATQIALPLPAERRLTRKSRISNRKLLLLLKAKSLYIYICEFRDAEYIKTFSKQGVRFGVWLDTRFNPETQVHSDLDLTLLNWFQFWLVSVAFSYAFCRLESKPENPSTEVWLFEEEKQKKQEFMENLSRDQRLMKRKWQAEKLWLTRKRIHTLKARLSDEQQAVKGFLIEHYQKVSGVAVQNPCLEGCGKVLEVAFQNPCLEGCGKILEVAFQNPCSAPTEFSTFDTVAQDYRSVINLDRVKFPHQRFLILPSPISRITQTKSKGPTVLSYNKILGWVIKKLKTRRFKNKVLKNFNFSTKISKGDKSPRLSPLPSDRYCIYSTLISAARETRFLRKPRKNDLVSCKPPLSFLAPNWHIESKGPLESRSVSPSSPRNIDVPPPQVKHGWHVRPVSRSGIRLEDGLREHRPKFNRTNQHLVKTVYEPAVLCQVGNRFHLVRDWFRNTIRWRQYRDKIFCKAYPVYNPSPVALRVKSVDHATGLFRSVKHLTLKKSHPCKPRLKRFWLDVESSYFTRNKSSDWACKGEFCLLLTGFLLDNLTKPQKFTGNKLAFETLYQLTKEKDEALSHLSDRERILYELYKELLWKFIPKPRITGAPIKPETGSGFDAFGLSCRVVRAEKQGQEGQLEQYDELLRKEKHKTSGLAIQEMLTKLDLKKAYKRLKVEEIPHLNSHISSLGRYSILTRKQKSLFLKLIERRFTKARRLILIKNLCGSEIKPEWMALSNLPILPPDLRPIIELDGVQVIVADLNRLYQQVVSRNNRCLEWEYHSNTQSRASVAFFLQRQLQLGVDALIENGKGGSAPILAHDGSGRPLKSLSDILKGKKGRFRLNLLGKRVDYSGRSVIVVGPTLKLQECGLPLEMALVLFLPFLIRQLIVKELAFSILHAKGLIKRFEERFSKTHKKPVSSQATFSFVKLRNNQLSLLTKHVESWSSLTVDSVIWEILHETMRDHPVLLNRAPTLHRLGFQAFQPKLVDGSAILLHPLVCPGFNADFDGDQMAVHVPLSLLARAEAWNIMWARNNLLSPATGQPILVPSQDMVLGCYYLTALKNKPLDSQEGFTSGTALVRTAKPEFALKVKPGLSQQNRFYPVPGFSSFTDVLKAYYQSKLKVHTPVWVKASGALVWGMTFEEPLEARISLAGKYDMVFSFQQKSYEIKNNVSSKSIRTTPGRILLNNAISQASSSTSVYNPSPSSLV